MNIYLRVGKGSVYDLDQISEDVGELLAVSSTTLWDFLKVILIDAQSIIFI